MIKKQTLRATPTRRPKRTTLLPAFCLFGSVWRTPISAFALGSALAPNTGPIHFWAGVKKKSCKHFKKLKTLSHRFQVDNKLVPWDELISSDALLNELAHALSRCGGPSMTFEIQKELLRLHWRWMKQQSKSEKYLKVATEHTFFLTADCEDEDDIFMPSTKAKSTAPSKGKSSTLSKRKSSSSSKGKSSASTEDDDDDFMSFLWCMF